jgi:hypothetical protein
MFCSINGVDADDKEEDPMKHLRQIVFLVRVPSWHSPTFASAWNSPGHMLSAAIAYQVLQQ